MPFGTILMRLAAYWDARTTAARPVDAMRDRHLGLCPTPLEGMEATIQHAFGPQGPGALFTLRASRRGRSGLGDERRRFKKDSSNISTCTPGVTETGGLAGKSAKILSHHPTAC